MATAWTVGPKTRLGWSSVILAGIALLLFCALSLWVEAMSQSGDTNVTTLNIGIIPAAIGLVSIILGWVAFAARKDRSWLLLVVTIAMSLQALFVVVFEGLEALL